MILTQKKIEIVADFVAANKVDFDNGTYKFPEVSSYVSELAGIPFEFTMIYRGSNDEYTFLFNENIYILLYRNGFKWELTIEKKSLFQVTNLIPVIEALSNSKHAIEEMFEKVKPVYEKMKETDKLRQKAKWGLEEIDSFFNYYSPNYEPVNTDEKLKELNKIKFEDWDENVFRASVEGKRVSIDWYERVFESFEQSFNKISELYSETQAGLDVLKDQEMERAAAWFKEQYGS